MALLEVRDLRVSFNTAGRYRPAVRGLSFDVERGQTLAIVGESGSGKSVSTQTITGLTRGAQVSGTAYFDGTDLISADQATLRRMRGRPDRHDLPGPAVQPAPALPDRLADRRDDPGARPDDLQAGGPATGRRAADPGRHPAGRGADRRLPAPVLRRDAAAGDDRDGDGARPGAADRGRADHRAGRHRAGPGART